MINILQWICPNILSLKDISRNWGYFQGCCEMVTTAEQEAKQPDLEGNGESLCS